MNSNREERLQMRQRGAATRKTKDIDFGFSFGLGPAIGEAPSQSMSQPEPPRDDPPPLPAAVQPQPTPSTPTLGGSRSQDRETGQQRTPGSARNALPERPSMFDIPDDDNEEPSPVRSNKRRKIETPTKVSRSSTGPHPDSIRDEIRTESVQDMPKGAGWKPDEAPEVPLAVTHEKKQPPEVLGPVPDVPMKTQHDGEPRVNGGDEEAPVIEEAPSQEIPQEAQARVAPEAAPQAAPREAREAQAVPEAAQDGKEAQAASEVPKAPEVPEVQPVPEPAPEPETAAEPAKPAPEASTHTSQPPSEEAEAPQGLPGPRRTYPRQDAKSKRKRSVSQEQPSPENVTAPEAPIETFQPPEEKSPQELPESKRLSSRRGAKGKRKRESPEQPSQEDITASGPPPEAPRPREEAPQGLPEPKHTSRQNAKDKRTRESPEEKPSGVTAPEVTEAPTEASQPQEPQEAPEARRTSPRRGARGKRRRGSPEQLSPAGVAVPEAGEDAPEPEQPLEQQDYVDEAPIKSQEKRRGHPASARELDNDKEPEGEAVDSASQKQSKGRRGRKAKNREVPTTKKPSQPDVEDEAQPKETTEVRPQLPKENATRKRGRPGKKAAPESQGSREPEAVQVELAAPARGPDDRTGPAAEQPAAKRPTEPEPEQPEQPKEQQAPAEANKPTKRKPRSRGETVPVTVHRLANIATLGNFPDSDSEESADELATRQKTRHPNRGGVNQADVLNQICRETLDKTLTTLKNGITNETNPTRKAEWTRKKKAVEAFGAELEGRLFEMSEMLDSNFVLGVQVRRAKREMMEMRSRLYHVRREREAIAVQMDGVRRRYAEEESVRVSRTNISDTLHSLELAVDRSQQHQPEADHNQDEDAPTTTMTAGLEYLLRAVGEEVSSRGDHGGLLNQIKAFNAELEGAARWIEG